MTALVNATITAAAAGVVTPWAQMRDGTPETMALQATLTYGSGGTSITAWVQTSLDGGLTASDVTNFAFTTASARVGAQVSALTAIGTPVALTDSTLASNSSAAAPIGPLWRVKYTSVGTYAGGTTLRVDAVPNRGKLTPLI